jgi:hypothetical protein
LGRSVEFNVYGTNAHKWEEVMRYTKPISAKVTKVLWFTKASLELSAYLSRSDVALGEHISVYIQVRNHSTQHIGEINVSLLQHIEIVADQLQKKMPQIRVLDQVFSCSFMYVVVRGMHASV